MVPVVITPEILDEVERDKARRALVSRVQGNKSAVLDDPIFFAAERREVKLSHDTIELEPIDCELLDQMTRTVFRQLDMKVKSSRARVRFAYEPQAPALRRGAAAGGFPHAGRAESEEARRRERATQGTARAVPVARCGFSPPTNIPCIAAASPSCCGGRRSSGRESPPARRAADPGWRCSRCKSRRPPLRDSRG